MARTRYQEGELIPFTNKRSSGWVARWRIDVLENGKVRRRYTTKRLYKKDYPTERLAKRRLDELVAEVNDPDYRVRPTATIREFSKLYIEKVLTQHKASGQSTDKSRINIHIVPVLGDVQLKDLNGQIMTQFVFHLRFKAKQRRKGKVIDKPLSAKTVVNIYKVLSSMWNKARAWGYVKREKFEDMSIDLPEVVTPEQRYYTADECARIIAAAKYPFNLMFWILSQTGIRIGEALGLHVEDVDTERLLLTVKRSVFRGIEQTPKSKRSERRIDISPKLATAITEYVQGGWVPCESRLLFHTESGRPIDYSNFSAQVLKPLLAVLNISGGAFHAFRHGNATFLDKENTPMRVRQDRLGHVDQKTTFGYTHAISADGRRAAEQIDAMLFEVKGPVQ